ncbi:enoyl-CoA hydratase/isomerase family protein [Desulfoscipio gibsoniae]|uniref:Enoyl-CoA hydratase/carnithine racemase n=1 Tax=Desulfoscipio gibsoniae DSM 7213 TaxID=767817 RepID=R4KE15_9FIRM|nr:enoyl-CoA hydratase/isomerase family protein [Desulfoscipio gibsoniae]AGL01413.1 enoyl-CoA hydratase/carnithine racemase [Desulfoscipio gibsoniae DSM 7213]
MSYNFIKVSNEDGLISITLNSPPLNVLTIPMMEELADAFAWAKEQSGSLIVLGAEGKAFSAGVDVADHTPDKVSRMIEVFDSIFHNMYANDKPIVAAVNGAALGGGYELVLFCDMVVASEKAKFGQPEIAVGVFPPLASYMLPRLTSMPHAMELLLSGEVFNAAKADKLGLVNTVLPVDSFDEGVMQFLQRFMTMSPIVLAMTKKAIKAGLNKGFVDGLKAIDDIYLNELMPTADAVEGLKAFMEKRKPVWQGK